MITLPVLLMNDVTGALKITGWGQWSKTPHTYWKELVKLFDYGFYFSLYWVVFNIM